MRSILMPVRELLSTSREQRLERLRALPLVGMGLRWAHRTVEVAMIDRSMGLAAQFIASLIPLLLVISTFAPSRKDPEFWNALARWLGLRGASASTLKQLIGTGGDLQVDTTGLEVLILIISALSFIRALQRAYEQVWELKPLSLKNTPRQMVWLLVFVVTLWIVYQIRRFSFQIAVISPLLVTCYVLTAVLFWWLTPYLLLGGRIGFRSLLPGAVTTCVALGVYGLVSITYMPGRINASAQHFGPLGLIFIILSWYFILFCILVGGAAIGPTLLEEDNALARFLQGGDGARRAIGTTTR
jgi:membrane protein